MSAGKLALVGREIEATQGLRPSRFKFTESTLKDLPLPRKGGKAIIYRDEQTVGFVCVCTQTVRTLYIRRRQRGASKVVWIRLGAVGDKPLAEFRIEAQSKGAQLSSGTDPVTQLPKRGALTLGRAFDDYLAAKPKLAPGTRKTYKADFDTFVGSWRTRSITSITAADVARRHTERSAESPARADGALRILRAVERYAKASASARGEALTVDLLAMIRAGKSWNNVARRSTHLDHRRRAAWIAAVCDLPDDNGHSLSGTQRDALLLLAATGLRLREGLSLAWSEVDLKRATLSLSPARMKGGRPHTLPIPRRTLAILKARRAADAAARYVFRGPRAEARRLADPDSEAPLDRISRQVFSAIDVDFTPHDLRRTVASWLGANAPAYVVKAVLSHSDPSKSSDVTAGYVILDANDLRPWLQKWEDQLYEARKRRVAHGS